MDIETLHKLQRLANVHLNEEKIPQFATDLQKILDMAAQLQNVHTPFEHQNFCFLPSMPMRDDKAISDVTPDDLMRNAPCRHEHANLFSVPKVIDQ